MTSSHNFEKVSLQFILVHREKKYFWPLCCFIEILCLSGQFCFKAFSLKILIMVVFMTLVQSCLPYLGGSFLGDYTAVDHPPPFKKHPSPRVSPLLTLPTVGACMFKNCKYVSFNIFTCIVCLFIPVWFSELCHLCVPCWFGCKRPVVSRDGQPTDRPSLTPIVTSKKKFNIIIFNNRIYQQFV